MLWIQEQQGEALQSLAYETEGLGRHSYAGVPHAV